MQTDQISNQLRILAISLSSRGFGYAVMEENNRLVDYGKKVINEEKNIRSLEHVNKLIIRSQPDVIVLHNVKSRNARGTRRNPRIKELDRKVVTLAKKHKLKIVKISGTELRLTLLGNERGTKQEMAELLAKKFPDELVSRMPIKRKAWTSEDSRMDIFDAVALAVVFRLRKGSQGVPNDKEECL